jgi:hypothetical protein
VVSSVFYLDQTVDPKELVARLRKLASVLKGMAPEQFRQVMVWLKNVIKRKLPKPLQKEVDRVLGTWSESHKNLREVHMLWLD